MLRALILLGFVGASLLVAGCGDDETRPGPKADEPPFGGPDDVQRAQDLWKSMQDYKDWTAYPGFDGWQEGQSPHGTFLRYYVNPVAADSPDAPPHGSIIIKENYPEKDAAKLGPVTVMQRVPDYDPENHDWFWVKFSPDGKVMSNQKGRKLAGRVGKGGATRGCIPCHTRAQGDDLLFINDE